MSGHVPTYWLSMHLPYACQHAGECCTASWDIPIERARVEAVSTLRPSVQWLRPVEGGSPEMAGLVAKSGGGRCVFHGDGCEIQHVRGHGALPSACQHFPRQVLVDGRGVFVSLSHYCPTAAELLFSHEGPVEIVEGPPALPVGDPEGLDAREVLPPLLVPGVRSRHAVPGVASRGQVWSQGILMDLAGYSAWEAHMVAILTRDALPADKALRELESDLARIQQWRPGSDSLASAIALLQREKLTTTCSDASATSQESVIRRYLAARAFACWAAYQSVTGIAAILSHLRLALEIIRGHQQRLPLKEAIRMTDLRLVHGVESTQSPPIDSNV